MEELNLKKVKINGLHYTEIVYEIRENAEGKNTRVNPKNKELEDKDTQDIPVSKILFKPNGEIVKEVWDYIVSFDTKSYHTRKQICDDLRHIYDYLMIKKLDLSNLDESNFSIFIDYLIAIQPKPKSINLTGLARTNNLAIERSLYKRVPLHPAYDDSKVTAISPGISLPKKSITRITGTTKNFIVWLVKHSPYRYRYSTIKLERIFKRTTISFRTTGGRATNQREIWTAVEYLKAKEVYEPPFNFQEIEPDRYFDENQAKILHSVIINERDKFLHFLLDITGVRISEALGLIIIAIPKRGLGASGYAFKTMQGDILLNSKGRWEVNIIRRPNNPPGKRSKSKKDRKIEIEKRYESEFTEKLSRYLNWRSGVMFKHNAIEHNWLFISRTGTSHSYYAARGNYNRYKIMAGLSSFKKLTLHSWRHHNASEDFNRGVPIVVKAKDLGDTPEVVEGTYTHPDKEKLDKAQQTAANNIAGKRTIKIGRKVKVTRT